jgi:thiamine biosynthesis lipoprotein ApbE
MLWIKPSTTLRIHSENSANVNPRGLTPSDVDTRILSVSVVFPRWGCNGLADGLTTAGSVIGWRELFPMVTRQGGEALVIVQEEGRVTSHATPGWENLLEQGGI